MNNKSNESDEQASEWTSLQGGMTNSVFHKEGMVRRPLRDSSPAIHQFLIWLHEQGFDRVPAFIHATEDEEFLSFIDGEAVFRPWPESIQQDAWMSQLAHWLRDFQQASSGFHLKYNAEFLWGPKTPSVDMVVSHGDLGLWNCIHQNGILQGVIDWDMARYGHPLDDLAQLAWEAVPLRDNVESAFGQIVDDDILVARLTRLCAEYGNVTPHELIQHLLNYITQITEEVKTLAKRGLEPFVSYVDRDFISDYQKDHQFIREHWLTHPLIKMV